MAYKPGKEHANADFLSRIQVVTEEERTDFTDNIIEEQRKNETCSKIISYLTDGTLIELDKGKNPIWVKEMELFYIKGGVLRRDFHSSSRKRRRFVQQQTVVPYSPRKNIITEYHDSILAEHLAFLRTYFQIRDKFYRPEMLKDIKEYCQEYGACDLLRSVETRAFLHPLEIATALFEVIGMDFLEPIKPESCNGIEIDPFFYSTHQTIRYTPQFSMHSYGATCLT